MSVGMRGNLLLFVLIAAVRSRGVRRRVRRRGRIGRLQSLVLEIHCMQGGGDGRY